MSTLPSVIRSSSRALARTTWKSPERGGLFARLSTSPRYDNSSDAPKKASSADIKQDKISESGSTSPEIKETYKSGDTYFSFNPYSFYDIETKMEKDRLPQPSSSNKKNVMCMHKLNPPPPAPVRNLLPEEFGYLVEYPGKKVYKFKPFMGPMRGRYQVQPESEFDLVRRNPQSIQKIPL